MAAYEVGGLPDLVEHLVTGYLARPRDPNDLADGIQWLVNNRSMNLRECIANKSAMRHSPARATESSPNFTSRCCMDKVLAHAPVLVFCITGRTIPSTLQALAGNQGRNWLR